MHAKREVRILVRDGDDMRELRSLDEAAKFLNLTFSDATKGFVDDTTDAKSTVVILAHDGSDPSVASARQFDVHPPEHRGAFLVSGLALMYSMPSRDPVVVEDTGDAFVMVAARASRLVRYLFTRYGQRTPIDSLPTNVAERWVASISSSGELCAIKIGVGVRPGIAQA
jgi:hypothetical protein